MEIYYMHKYTKFYTNPRKENLGYYSKMAIYIEGKIEYKYVKKWHVVITKDFLEKYHYNPLSYYPCAFISNEKNHNILR